MISADKQSLACLTAATFNKRLSHDDLTTMSEPCIPRYQAETLSKQLTEEKEQRYLIFAIVIEFLLNI